MKRVISIVTAAVMLIMLLGLSACGTASQKDSSQTTQGTTEAQTKATTAKPAEKVTLRVFSRYSDNTPNTEVFKKGLEEFQNANPNITMEDMSINDGAQFDDKFKVAVAAGNVPEVFENWGGEVNRKLAQNGILGDLSQYLNADKAWKDLFPPVMFKPYQYDGINGTFAIPLEYYAIGIYYNKDLFAKAGLEPPKTIKDLLDCAPKFKAMGIIPLYIGNKDNWRSDHFFNSLFSKSFPSSKIKDLSDRKAKYEDPDMLELFKTMETLYKAGVFGENITGVDYNSEKAMFANEKSAMHMDGTWYVGEANTTAIKDKIGYISFPAVEGKDEFKNNLYGTAGAAWAISGATKGAVRDAAVKYLKYVTSKEYFTKLRTANKGGSYPVKLDPDPSVESPLSIEVNKLILNANELYVDVAAADSDPKVWNELAGALQGVLAGGSAEKAAKTTAAAATPKTN